MLERLKNWLRPRKEATGYTWDEHMVSIAMLEVLLRNGMSREELAEVFRSTFDPSTFTNARLDDVLAAIDPSASEGFRVLVMLGFLVFATNISIEEIAAFFDSAFSIEGARNLPEVSEAHRRMHVA